MPQQQMTQKDYDLEQARAANAREAVLRRLLAACDATVAFFEGSQPGTFGQAIEGYFREVIAAAKGTTGSSPSGATLPPPWWHCHCVVCRTVRDADSDLGSGMEK